MKRASLIHEVYNNNYIINKLKNTSIYLIKNTTVYYFHMQQLCAHRPVKMEAFVQDLVYVSAHQAGLETDAKPVIKITIQSALYTIIDIWLCSIFCQLYVSVLFVQKF